MTEKVEMLTAADVMTQQVLTVTPATPIREIASLLYTKNISGVPVVDESGQVVGIVSEGDLMGHAAAIGERPRRRSWLAALTGGAELAHDYAKAHGAIAEDVMSRGVQTIAETATLPDVVKLMERHRIKRLPVERDGKLVGIVTRRDILRILATSNSLRPTSVDDRTIRDNLLTELGRQPWAGLGAKNIIVEKGVVHLFGSVETEDERRAIVAAARTISGVTDVEDHLAPAVHLPI